MRTFKMMMCGGALLPALLLAGCSGGGAPNLSGSTVVTNKNGQILGIQGNISAVLAGNTLLVQPVMKTHAVIVFEGERNLTLCESALRLGQPQPYAELIGLTNVQSRIDLTTLRDPSGRPCTLVKGEVYTVYVVQADESGQPNDTRGAVTLRYQ